MDLKFTTARQKFVGHRIAATEKEKPSAIMYEYLLAGNGLFLSAARKEFSVCLPLFRENIKGLPNAQEGIFWKTSRIPGNILQEILTDARHASDFEEFKEDVFVIFRGEEKWGWKKVSRERQRAATIADDTLEEYANACIELHTHPDGAIHFSGADDADESGKFRIFAILTDIHSRSPSIRFRCGVYNYFFQIRAEQVMEMPDGIIDLNKRDEQIRKIIITG
jgi:PRTRC genetic system protein A